MLTDNFGRPVKSMRIQVNTTCNFKCFFCHMEGTGMDSSTLTPREIERVVEIASKWGVDRIKFTGGEPLLRPDIVEIVERTRKHVRGNISMTTNGYMLPEYAKSLKEAGLDRVNISLHSLDRDTFEFITGTDSIDKVREGIKAARDARLDPIKINFVVLKGVNVDQVPRMITLSAEENVTVQFIEFETNRENENSEEFMKYHYDLNVIERKLKKRAIRIEHNDLHNRPIYTVREGDGTSRIEFVKPMHNYDFCNNCTRIRLTSTGFLKPCLMRGDNYQNIISSIRKGGPEESLDEIYKKALLSREPYWKLEDTVKSKIIRAVES